MGFIYTAENNSPTWCTCYVGWPQAYVLYRLATTVQMVLVLFTLSVAFNVRIPAFLIVLLALVADLTAIPISADRAVPYVSVCACIL